MNHYEQGRRDFTAGKTIAENPHKSGILEHEEWARGWSAARWTKQVHDRAAEAERARDRAAKDKQTTGMEFQS